MLQLLQVQEPGTSGARCLMAPPLSRADMISEESGPIPLCTKVTSS